MCVLISFAGAFFVFLARHYYNNLSSRFVHGKMFTKFRKGAAAGLFVQF